MKISYFYFGIPGLQKVYDFMNNIARFCRNIHAVISQIKILATLKFGICCNFTNSQYLKKKSRITPSLITKDTNVRISLVK